MNHFRNADRQAGGSRLYAAVLQHLARRVAPRLVDSDSGRQAFAAAAAMTEMAGWMAHDSGLDQRAEQHFARALSLARVSGDMPLAANIAASSSQLALHAGAAAHAVGWARTGLELAAQGPRIPALIARLYTMEARALAAAGQHGPAARGLEAARPALSAPAGGEHPWLGPFDAAALAGESALILRDLGLLDRALEQAEEAVALREAGRARSLALSRISQVDIHVLRGDLDAALAAGNDLLGTGPLLGSVRVVRQLGKLRQQLAPHTGNRPVREYVERFDESRRARMLLLADIIPPPFPGGIPA